MLLKHLNSLPSAASADKTDDFSKSSFADIEYPRGEADCRRYHAPSVILPQSEVRIKMAGIPCTRAPRSSSTAHESSISASREPVDDFGTLTRDYMDRLILSRQDKLHEVTGHHIADSSPDTEHSITENMYSSRQDSSDTQRFKSGYWAAQLRKFRHECDGDFEEDKDNAHAADLDLIISKENYVYVDKKIEQKKLGKCRIPMIPNVQNIASIKSFMSTYTPPSGRVEKHSDEKDKARRSKSSSSAPVLRISSADREQRELVHESPLLQIRRRHSTTEEHAAAKGKAAYSNTLQALLQRSQNRGACSVSVTPSNRNTAIKHALDKECESERTSPRYTTKVLHKGTTDDPSRRFDTERYHPRGPNSAGNNIRRKSSGQIKSSCQIGQSPLVKPIFNRCQSVQNETESRTPSKLQARLFSHMQSETDRESLSENSSPINYAGRLNPTKRFSRQRQDSTPPRAAPRPADTFSCRSKSLGNPLSDVDVSSNSKLPSFHSQYIKQLSWDDRMRAIESEPVVRRVQIQPIATVVPTYGALEVDRKATPKVTLSKDDYRTLMEFKITEMFSHHLSCHNINFDFRVKNKFTRKQRSSILNELKDYAASDVADLITWRLAQAESCVSVKV